MDDLSEWLEGHSVTDFNSSDASNDNDIYGAFKRLFRGAGSGGRPGGSRNRRV